MAASRSTGGAGGGFPDRVPVGSRRSRTHAQRMGDAGEALVAARLRAMGWTVLGTQVRVGRDEIDVLAVDRGPPAALVAVEVRWRSRRDFGLPEETFDGRKRRHVARALRALLAAGVLADGTPLPRHAPRVDFVALEPGDAGEPGRFRHHRAVEVR